MQKQGAKMCRLWEQVTARSCQVTDFVTGRDVVSLKKLRVTHPVKKFPSFM